MRKLVTVWVCLLACTSAFGPDWRDLLGPKRLRLPVNDYGETVPITERLSPGMLSLFLDEALFEKALLEEPPEIRQKILARIIENSYLAKNPPPITPDIYDALFRNIFESNSHTQLLAVTALMNLKSRFPDEELFQFNRSREQSERILKLASEFLLGKRDISSVPENQLTRIAQYLTRSLPESDPNVEKLLTKVIAESQDPIMKGMFLMSRQETSAPADEVVARFNMIFNDPSTKNQPVRLAAIRHLSRGNFPEGDNRVFHLLRNTFEHATEMERNMILAASANIKKYTPQYERFLVNEFRHRMNDSENYKLGETAEYLQAALMLTPDQSVRSNSEAYVQKFLVELLDTPLARHAFYTLDGLDKPESATYDALLELISNREASGQARDLASQIFYSLVEKHGNKINVEHATGIFLEAFGENSEKSNAVKSHVARYLGSSGYTAENKDRMLIEAFNRETDVEVQKELLDAMGRGSRMSYRGTVFLTQIANRLELDPHNELAEIAFGTLVVKRRGELNDALPEKIVEYLERVARVADHPRRSEAVHVLGIQTNPTPETMRVLFETSERLPEGDPVRRIAEQGLENIRERNPQRLREAIDPNNARCDSHYQRIVLGIPFSTN